MDFNKHGKLKCMKSCYKWEVNRASIESLNPDDGVIHSPTLPIHNHHGFQLQLHPYGSSDRSSRYASLFLKLVSKTRLHVKFHLWILGENDRRHASFERTELFARKAKLCWGSKHFVLKSELENLYSPSGDLRICCEISFGIAVFETLLENEPPRKRPRLEEEEIEPIKPKSRFEMYFDNELHSDAKFVLPDGRCIYAHAIVLESRSDIFAEMFTDDEAVDMKGIDYEVLYETIRFVYTDKVENMDELAEKLLEPAIRFGLDDLKALCERNLCERVSVRSAIESLILAEEKNLLGLRDRAKKFIAANIKDIVHLPEFEAVMTERPSVALAIVRCNAERKAERR